MLGVARHATGRRARGLVGQLNGVLIQLRAEMIAHAAERLDSPDAAHELVFAAEERADRLAAQLASDDLALARVSCAEVGGVLWPNGGLPADHWWQSPLGRVMAGTFEMDDAEPVNQKGAAAMLGVNGGTVARLVSVGVLNCHLAGGIRRSSVVRRVARTA